MGASGGSTRAARGVGWTVLAVMLVALAYASTAGEFWPEAAVLASLPWGQVTLVETYVGYALVGVWIVNRERRAWTGAAWILAICVLGHLVSALYVLRAAARAGDSARRFWMGR